MPKPIESLWAWQLRPVKTKKPIMWDVFTGYIGKPVWGAERLSTTWWAFSYMEIRHRKILLNLKNIKIK